MVNQKELCNRFECIRTHSQNNERAPHKPLLILCAIARCLNGKERLVTFDQAKEQFQPILKKPYGRKGSQVLHPFWRLKHDNQIWEVTNDQMVILTSSGDPRIESLRKNNCQGGFTYEVYHTLRNNPNLAIEIVHFLLLEHFPETLHHDILADTGLTETIQQHEFSYSFDKYGLSRRRKRDPLFAKQVTRAYGNQCAVCNFAVSLDGNNIIGLEAAHIKWHSHKGPDEINNGLSLCSLHHKLFDLGAFTLSKDDYSVQVSDCAIVNGSFDPLYPFDSKVINLPFDEIHYPNKSFLDWHQQEVFK